MAHWIDPILVLVLLLNFVTLGASHLRTVIGAVAMQGVLLGVMMMFAHSSITWRLCGLASASVALKGIALPQMLSYAMREVSIRREIEPLIGFIASLLLGAIGTALAVVFGRTLPLAPE